MNFGLRESVRYHIDFKSNWIDMSSFFAGLSFFLLFVYYFGFKNLADVGGGELIFSFLLPILLIGGYIVLLRIFNYNVTPMYGVLGAGYCLFMILRTVVTGSFLGILIAVLWYLLTAVVCLSTCAGFIPTKVPMVAAFTIPVIFCLVFVDLGKYILSLDLIGFIPEAAALSGLLAFCLFALCLHGTPVKASRRTE